MAIFWPSLQVELDFAELITELIEPSCIGSFIDSSCTSFTAAAIVTLTSGAALSSMQLLCRRLPSAPQAHLHVLLHPISLHAFL